MAMMLLDFTENELSSSVFILLFTERIANFSVDRLNMFTVSSLFGLSQDKGRSYYLSHFACQIHTTVLALHSICSLWRHSTCS